MYQEVTILNNINIWELFKKDNVNEKYMRTFNIQTICIFMCDVLAASKRYSKKNSLHIVV